jgi:predicted esterase
MSTGFQDLQQQLFELYRLKRYEKALALLATGLARFPDRSSRIGFWIACLECRLDRPQQALDTLTAILEQGEWFSPRRLTGDQDLGPLRGMPEFARLVAACEERRRVEQERILPELRLEPPAPVAEAKPPLVMALHMMGGDANESIYHWRPVTTMGAALAAPRGSELLGPGEFGWSEDSEAELRQHLLSVAARQPFDGDRLVLGGASQGARYAVRLALRGTLAARGFVAIVAAPPVEEIEAHLETARRAGVRGVFITGELDGARAGVEAAHRLLEEGGLAVRLEVLPGLGHEYPADLPRLLEEALDFVLA